MSHIIQSFFSVDHDRLDRLFTIFRQRVVQNSEQARPYFTKFREGLTRHIEWEENLLFPRFEKASGMTESGPTQVMRSEHIQIRALLEEIEDTLEMNKPSASCIEQLEQMLTMHNMKEERVLYVQCDQLISKNDVDKMLLELN